MGHRLLVIDDDEVCCRLVAAIFKARGFDIAAAGAGDLGIAQVESFKPDVVVLDFQLPDMDGLAVLQILKRKHPRLPVVLLTGQADVKTAVRAMQYGAFDYVTKPFQVQDMVNLVARALATPQSPAEAAAQRLLAVIELQNAIAAASLDLDNVLRAVVQRAGALTAASGAVVEMVDGEDMVYRAVSGSVASFMGLRLKRKTSLSGLCIEQRIPLRSDDTTQDPRVDRAACQRAGILSMICVPLLRDDEAMGVLKVVSSRPHAFGEEDVGTLELLAQTIAVAMQQAQAHQTMVRDSYHDALTGLLNRRSFEQRLRDEIARFGRYRQPLSLAMLDLDGFKAANDRWGHLAGDEVLRQVAELLKRTTRDTDLCFRFGGDEFAILMPNTANAGAVVLAERLAEAFVSARLAEGTVGVSLGLAEAKSTAPDDLVSRADAALYANKHARKKEKSVLP